MRGVGPHGPFETENRDNDGVATVSAAGVLTGSTPRVVGGVEMGDTNRAYTTSTLASRPAS